MRAAGLVTLIALSLAACVAADKGAEEELDLVDSADGKDDSLRRPTEHGDLAFDVAAHSALTEAERHHAWTFTLHGDADVTMTTAYSLLGQRRTDTVLYLYRETAAGWGAYIARNDDYGSTTYSQLVRHLGAGRYRMIVKGHLATTRGKFKLTAACRGDGCTAPVATDVCVLPEDYTALRNDPRFVLQEGRVITSADQLAEHEAEQVLFALRRVYGDVPTIAAGLALADDARVNYRLYYDSGSNTDLTVVELGAGDTSVGAIYYGTSLQLAGAISDLFIVDCALFAPHGLGATAAGGSCRAGSDCAAGLQCLGGFANAGVCNSTVRPAGDGAECDVDADCGAGLVCAGATRGYGRCNPAWQRGAFTDAAIVAVPDGGTVAARLVVRGLATVDTDVVVRATIEHPRASQLRVTLTNPAGAEVLLHDGTAADDGAALVIDRPILGFSGDESVNGEWTLRIVDRATGSTGRLAGWTLIVTSRWD